MRLSDVQERSWDRRDPAVALTSILPNGAFAMPLQRGEVHGYDFNRSVVEFTMLNQAR